MTEANHTSRLSELHTVLGYMILVQIMILMLAALLLDGGYCERIFGIAMLGYWLMVGWFALRRRNALTKTDVILIHSGFFLWLGLAISLQTALEYFT